MSDPTFWNDADKAREISQKATEAKDAYETYTNLFQRAESLKDILDLAIEEDDQEMEPEIAEELGEEPFWHIQETFNLIEKKLKENPKPIIIDEVDYLLERNTIETLRDLYDTTSCPLVLVGMSNIDKKLSRYPHIIDRIYKSFKFERYDFEDVKQILNELTQITFTSDGVEYLATRVNQFRQIVKLINKIEKLAITNQLKQIDENILRKLLYGRSNIETLQKAQQIYA